MFVGASPPSIELPLFQRLLGWGWWVIQMVGAAFVKITIIVLTVAEHDRHHVLPQLFDWADSSNERQREKELREEKGEFIYRDRWGLVRSIDQTFRELSQFPAVAPSGCKPDKEVRS